MQWGPRPASPVPQPGPLTPLLPPPSHPSFRAPSAALPQAGLPLSQSVLLLFPPCFACPLSLPVLLCLCLSPGPAAPSVCPSVCLSISALTLQHPVTPEAPGDKENGGWVTTLTCDRDIHGVTGGRPLLGGVAEGAVASVGPPTRRRQGAHGEASLAVHPRKLLSVLLRILCAPLSVQDKRVKDQP